MPAIVRKGDVNSAGGIALLGNPAFIVDGRPVCTIGTPVSPHFPCPRIPIHCHAVTMLGKQEYVINGIKVNVVGDIDSCGHPRVTGSPTFIVGG